VEIKKEKKELESQRNYRLSINGMGYNVSGCLHVGDMEGGGESRQ